MSKGDDTRQRILSASGALMNRTGYLATPVSDILAATGLQKGGLYNHFASKDELALEAYLTNARLLGDHLGRLARAPGDPVDILKSLLNASLDVAAGRIVPGGCPVLNAGIEADDASESLRVAAARSADALKRYFLLPLHRLERAGRLRPGTDPGALAVTLVAGVEGGILWTRVTRDPDGQRAVLATLAAMVTAHLRT